jgi:NAD(P)-dependent dehydrogenase (short-subunit alcohol dehydrogenase family)
MTIMDLQLADKVAIVTGSSRGLGFACAAALVREGSRVAICARGVEKLAEAEAELNRLAAGPGQILGVIADVSTAEGVERVVSTP